MSDLTNIKEVLQQCASVPISLLDGIGYDGKCDLVADVLFPVLGWDSDNNYQTPADGQFMEYMEWKEPYLDFDKFALIKQRGIAIEDEFLEHYAQICGDDDDEDDDFDGTDINMMFDAMIQKEMARFEAMRELFFNYFNEQLAGHGLKLVELGSHENAFFLLVHNNDDDIKKLTEVFANYDVAVSAG
ncbi:Uncharacterised protein [Moraxella lacunata]|uniref:Uncharacterized protein n=1 Tax=Moraxella lacunata TaxID=477 RepID=A0A378T6F6_MORLA|nr:hypothetical protein [Moraxella lacunata]STZ55483.1 Uncharacterised protein [Moraxella lacunata]